jgi:hypothetical protein
MIDTSIVRVHQHGGCAGGGETRLMGRSRGGLTTKIHACVDTNGLPVRLELTTGEAHDNRLVILSPLAAIAPFLFGAVAVSLAVAAICKCAYGREFLFAATWHEVYAHRPPMPPEPFP